MPQARSMEGRPFWIAGSPNTHAANAALFRPLTRSASRIQELTRAGILKSMPGGMFRWVRLQAGEPTIYMITLATITAPERKSSCLKVIMNGRQALVAFRPESSAWAKALRLYMAVLRLHCDRLSGRPATPILAQEYRGASRGLALAIKNTGNMDVPAHSFAEIAEALEISPEVLGPARLQRFEL